MMVLFVHNQIASENYPILSFIASWGVPGFFLLSGYLFFSNVYDLNIEVWCEKLKRRVKTLLIPYIFWNTAAALCVLAIAIFHFYSKGDSIELVERFNPWSIYVDFCHSGAPAHLVMWFVKDLIFLVLITPILYYLIKYLHWVFLPLLLLLLYIPVNCFLFAKSSFFFFALGAFVGVFYKQWHTLVQSKWIWVISIVLLAVYLVFRNAGIDYYVKPELSRLAGIMLCISIAAYFVSKGYAATPRLAASSFFIYAVHIFQPANGCTIHAFSFFIVGWFAKLLVDDASIVICIVSPFLTMAICYGLYRILQKYCNSLLLLLSGGR